MYEALSYSCMRPKATSVRGLQLLVYEALIYTSFHMGLRFFSTVVLCFLWFPSMKTTYGSELCARDVLCVFVCERVSDCACVCVRVCVCRVHVCVCVRERESGISRASSAVCSSKVEGESGIRRQEREKVASDGRRERKRHLKSIFSRFTSR